MERAAEWRGSPRATDKREFTHLINRIRPSKTDVFYDLGCGYGGPCIWIAPKVKKAIGIEDHYYRYLHAKRDVEKSGLHSITIIWNDISKVPYRDATILYSVISIGFEIIKKIQRQTKTGALVVLYGLPPYPLKSRRLFGEFYAMTTPFERVNDGDEFARIHLGTKRATMRELLKSIDADQRRDLKREIKDSDANWESLSNQAITIK
jgi:SAM-dependent methyltransferase